MFKIFFVTLFTLPISELSLMGLAFDLVKTNHRSSVPRHFWLGRMTRKIVSAMTYNVSNGTLKTLLYVTITASVIETSVCESNYEFGW